MPRVDKVVKETLSLVHCVRAPRATDSAEDELGAIQKQGKEENTLPQAARQTASPLSGLRFPTRAPRRSPEAETRNMASCPAGSTGQSQLAPGMCMDNWLSGTCGQELAPAQRYLRAGAGPGSAVPAGRTWPRLSSTCGQEQAPAQNRTISGSRTPSCAPAPGRAQPDRLLL